MIQWFRDLCRYRQDHRVLDLQSKLDEKDRLIAVLRAENETLAAVAARDRLRVQAEAAAYARQRAESEAASERQRIESSVR